MATLCWCKTPSVNSSRGDLRSQYFSCILWVCFLYKWLLITFIWRALAVKSPVCRDGKRHDAHVTPPLRHRSRLTRMCCICSFSVWTAYYFILLHILFDLINEKFDLVLFSFPLWSPSWCIKLFNLLFKDTLYTEKSEIWL